MVISEISIKRPVLAIMMSLALVLFGLVALLRLPVRELPDIDPPVVNVLTVYPGANAAVVETEVTEKLEEALNSIEGIKRLTSTSREQVSDINIEFDLSRDIELAAQDVRDRVSRVRGTLPDDIQEPVIAKQDADANPVIWIALFSDRYTPLELTQIAENQMKDRLQTVRGVSSIFIGGRKRFAMRLRLDADRMAAHGVTIQDVEQALRTQNVELPSGRVEGPEREMTILTQAELKSEDEFNRMVIRREGAAFVRLKDIGRAEVGAEDERSLARFNSKPAVGLGIVKQSKANTIEVARGIKEELEHLIPLLPPGVETFMPYDESIFVEASIREVWITLFIAFVLVLLTIFVFLRNVRSTLVPVLTIPVALIGTYVVLAVLGYSINILTMLALVLAIGIVVDDSIVVLENIYRHIEDGMPPMQAAFKGMKEIAFAVIATTLSLAAVFIPLAFQTTVTGRLFVEFAIALTGAVAISSFVALTLTPAVAARLLRPMSAVKHGSLFNLFERGFVRFQNHYQRLLTGALNHRVVVVVFSLVLVGITALIYTRLDSEFLPDEDKARLLVFTLTPEGSTTEYTDRMLQKVEGIVSETPETLAYFSAVGLSRSGPGQPNQAFMFIRLKEEDRTRGVADVVGGPMGLGARMIGEVEGALSFPIVPKAIQRGFGQPFQLVIQEQNLDRLNEISQAIANRLRGAGLLANVRSSYEVTKPELRIEIDRNRAAELGVSIADIARSMQIMFGGLDVSKLKIDGKEYDVIAQLDRVARLVPGDLDRLYVRNDRGVLVQLGNLVSFTTGAGPTAINHFNRFRSSTIEGTPMGVTLGTAVQSVEQILAEEFPGVRYDWSGETADLKEAGSGFLFVVILALIVVYMVLASQFDSLLHPFTIMLTLPLAAFGAFGLLWALNGVNTLGTSMFGWANYSPDPPAIAHTLSNLIPRIPAMNINLFSQIGMVLLIGMATKNSILLVEFANQQMNRGLSARDAMLQAGLIRFRPILMTSFSTILGILPIAIGWGAGGESRRPMGVAAVGGLLTSTFLTLLVVPVAYTLFAEWGDKIRGRRHGGSSALTTAITGLVLLFGLCVPSFAQSDRPAAADRRGSFDLARCLDTAVVQNYDILLARERVRQQYGAVVEVRSRVVPNLRVLGQYMEQETDLNMPGQTSEASWNLGVEVVQSLYAGGQNRASLQSQRLREEAAKLDLQATINRVLLDVRERYFAVLLARSQIRVQEQNIDLLQEELQSAQNKLDAGAVSPFNVLRADVALANGRTPLIRARNQYRIALEELARVLGFPPPPAGDEGTLDVTGELDFESYTASLPDERAAAFANRPELQSLELAKRAQERALRAARGGYQPSLNAFAGYNLQNDPISDDTWDEVHGWRAGLALNWSAFDGQQTKGRTLQAASALEQSRLAEEQARLEIDVEVRRANSSFIEAAELVQATRKVVEQAEESVRLARSRFDVGAATQLDVLQTQQALTQARDNEVQALHDYNVALARLRKAAGLLDRFGALAPRDDLP
ncbi:MAG TPA: efflux RND transporter permease subunit [Kiritimatiellia bacterium]|nr:efflux RND transporter permease subunit [Kiritimatiellia bacterium]